ncbi:hypothetical protein ACLOJK_027903 [Asimina triloba]
MAAAVWIVLLDLDLLSWMEKTGRCHSSCQSPAAAVVGDKEEGAVVAGIAGSCRRRQRRVAVETNLGSLPRRRFSGRLGSAVGGIARVGSPAVMVRKMVKDLSTMVAAINEGDDRVWIVSSSPCFSLDQICQLDVARGARRPPALKKTMEHRIWCSGGVLKSISYKGGDPVGPASRDQP